MSNKLIWLSYDLGFKGDYENLYYWLDSHKAKECGNSVATLSYEYKNNLIEELSKDLTDNISLAKNDRIYVIFRDEEDKLKGKFIIGRRKPSPWAGYAQTLEEDEDEVEK